MSDKNTGDLVLLEYALTSSAPTSGDWKRLGALKQKSVKVTREVKDATGDTSAATEGIATKFVTLEISGNGISSVAEAENQEDLEAIVSNGSAQPLAWLRVKYPSGKAYSAHCLVSEWSNDAPTDDVCTFSLSAKNNGAVTFTPST